MRIGTVLHKLDFWLPLPKNGVGIGIICVH